MFGCRGRYSYQYLVEGGRIKIKKLQRAILPLWTLAESEGKRPHSTRRGGRPITGDEVRNRKGREDFYEMYDMCEGMICMNV
jgi:hypothetical protein